MSLEILEKFEAAMADEFAKVKTALTPARKLAENDLKAIASTSVTYIETNGLQDAYQLGVTLLTGAATGNWGALLAALESQALAAGRALLKGESAIVLAQAQADLIAAGKLLPPAAAAA